MATEIVTANVQGRTTGIRVQAETRYTGTRGRMQTHDVAIAGHTIEGEWFGDGRQDTSVGIVRSHPLHAAFRLVLSAREAKRAYREQRRIAKQVAGTDDRYYDHVETLGSENNLEEARDRYRAAKAAVAADPLASQIVLA